MSEEVKPEIIKRTQVTLGKYVKRPVLTEKLLKKPPFRFLHDIINAVIKETGFLQGLYSSDELNPENIKDRNGKIAFLQKLIDALSLITKSEIAAKPSKIVAGLEPTKTNLLLQSLAKSLDKKLSSQEAVSIVNNKSKETKNSIKKSPSALQNNSKPKSQPEVPENVEIISKKQSKPETKIEPEKQKEEITLHQIDTRENSEVPLTKNKNEDPQTQSEITNGESQPENIKQETEIPKEEPKEEKIKRNEPQRVETENKRPQSAKHGKRRKSQNIIPSESVIENKQSEIKKQAESISREANNLNEEIAIFGDTENNNRPPLVEIPARAKSARPMSARPAAPRIREKVEAIEESKEKPVAKVNVITENDIKELDEEENFIVIESQSIQENENKNREVNEPEEIKDSDDHGRLVEQILETQKKLEKEDVNRLTDSPTNQGRKRVEIEWETEQSRNRENVSREIEKLVDSVQTVTRVANPLGKLMDFLQEDVEAMQRELATWQTNNIKLQENIKEQESLTEKMIEPLKLQLEEVENVIKDKMDSIKIVKANILRNEEKIKRLLNQRPS